MAINNALRKKRFKNKKGACFTVTIAVINSAVIKLAYVTNLAVIRLLYRYTYVYIYIRPNIHTHIRT